MREGSTSDSRSGFFAELQRRKVYRVAAAYIVVAGFLIQLSSATFPAWELPNWSLRLVITLLLIGFPIALILAWAYDITPHGIQLTPKEPGIQRRVNLVFLAVAAIIASVTAGFIILPRLAAHKIDKSIAVMPFQNLSDEKENAYFADGVQDDILTSLSKISDLKVISRTSVNSFRDGKRSAREVGKALGVGTLLEGSVRRMGNRVRVSVQLIDAERDQHLWAQDYERDLTNVFAIQTDLAQKIALALRARLSPNEMANLELRPTGDPDAYLLYVQAHDFANRPDHSRDLSLQAEELYERALMRDSNFAAALAGLSRVHSWAYHSFDPVPLRREKARSMAEKSLRLDPDLSEGHLALGFAYYYGERDYTRALVEFEIARRGLPNQADAIMAIGAIQRRQGKWQKSIVSLKKAVELDPKNATVLLNLGMIYLAMRDFTAADRIFDQAITAAPQAYPGYAFKALVAIVSKGDLDAAEKQLALITKPDTDGGITAARVWFLTLQRKFSDALQLLQGYPEEVLIAYEGACPKAFLEGTIHNALGDKAKAQAAFELARKVAEQLVQESPEDATRRSMLGQVLAGLGDKDGAIVAGKRAVELLPESEDAFSGPSVALSLAQIYIKVGEHTEALRLLERLLTTPNGVTVPLLEIDPVFDPLRNDPRFQALIDRLRFPRT